MTHPLDERGPRGGRRVLALWLVASALRTAAAEAPETDLDAWFQHLRVGMWMRVEGPRTPDGTVQASRIKVYDGELDEVAVDSEVAAVDLVRMTVQTTVGVRVVATPNTEIEGPGRHRHVNLAFLEIGDRVDVEGQLQKDGSLLAEKIDIEESRRLRPDLPSKNRHKVTARLESIDIAGRRIVLLGLPIHVNESTRIWSPLPD